MKQAEIIKKLKEGYYIKYEEISYTRRIFLYAPDSEYFVEVLNAKQLESLLSKGIIRFYSSDNGSMIHPNRTVQRCFKKYIYNTKGE